MFDYQFKLSSTRVTFFVRHAVDLFLKIKHSELSPQDLICGERNFRDDTYVYKSHNTSTNQPTRTRSERNWPCAQKKIMENRPINKFCWVHNAPLYDHSKNKHRGAGAMLHDIKEVGKVQVRC